MVDHDTFRHRLFRTHVAKGAQQISRNGDPTIGTNAGQPEIGDPDFPAWIDHQIRRFDVAMNDTQIMGMFQRQGGFDAQIGNRLEVAAIVYRSFAGKPCNRSNLGIRCRRSDSHPGTPIDGFRIALYRDCRVKPVRRGFGVNETPGRQALCYLCSGVAVPMLGICFAICILHHRCSDLDLLQLFNHLRKAESIDELHGVIMHTPFVPDRIDRHNILMVQ